MGMYTSGYTFQDKSENLPIDIERIKVYIHDILVLSKEKRTEHIEQLRAIFNRLNKYRMKVNTKTFNFLLNEITYL